jgi:urea transport system permease protein
MSMNIVKGQPAVRSPRPLRSRLSSVVFIAVLVALIIAVTLCNQLPASHPLHVSNYMVSLLGKYLTYAILAVSVDLVWGFLGILSLGHAAFFALGGYAMGMYLMRQIGDRGVYGNPELPDFMVFLNWTELPWYWAGFDSFAFTALTILLVPGLLAFVFGWFAFRSRVNGVYLSIITQAMTYALMLAGLACLLLQMKLSQDSNELMKRCPILLLMARNFKS